MGRHDPQRRGVRADGAAVRGRRDRRGFRPGGGAGGDQREVPHDVARARFGRRRMTQDHVHWPPEFAARYRASGHWRGQTFGALLTSLAEAYAERTAVVGETARW